MTKDTFTAALKHAQEVQGAYKITPSRRDALYDELASEGDADVLDALKRLGRSDKTINYYNIKAFIDDGKGIGYAKPAPPLEPISPGDKKAVTAMLDKLNEKLKWR